MRKIATVLFSILVMAMNYNVSAQKGTWNIGAELYNRYIWRGTDFGNSPVIQPTIEFSYGKFTLGAWGSYSTNSNTNGTEADIYASYEFNSGMNITITDYYFPKEPGSAGNYFNYNDYHFLEIGASKSFKNFNLSANYFINGDNDIYLEARYSFKKLETFIGIGNNNYTSDGNFNVCNIGISTKKEIKITDNFMLPLVGSVILNPEREQIFLVVGISI